MRQTICDRCDQIVAADDEENVRDVALIDQEERGGNGSIDNLGELCTRCIEALRLWMNTRQDGSRV